ncbi:MAG: glycosyltransferase family 4 protein [bacterium]
MNIAITIPNILVTGGAERVVYNLSRYLSKKHDITIVSLFTNDLNNIVSAFKMIHCNISSPTSLLSRFYIRNFPSKSLVDLLNSYDLVISNNVFRNYLNPNHIKTKSIDVNHLNYEESGGKPSLKKTLGLILRNHNFKSIDKLVVLTKQDEVKFCNSGLKNVVTIPNGLSFLPDNTADLNQKQVIAIGRLHYDKGHDNLIKAWIKVNKLFPDWHLKIYGDGPARNILEDMIINLNLTDSISLPGIVDNIMDKIMESGVFVMSSHYEGFGMTILESMVCGLPVVSFDCPTGPSEILQQGKFGFLAKNQNIEDLADKLILLMSSYELRQEYGRKARERALDYSWEKIGPLWDNLIDSM